MARGLVVLAALAALLAAGCGGGSSKPDGPDALIFVSVRDGDYAIFGSKADGSDAHRLSEEKGDPSTPAGLFFQNEPAWSPDGRRIAFASNRDGRTHIFVMDADGTNTRRITSSTHSDDHPTWSADGKEIVFAREGAIYRVPVVGGTAERVGRGPGSAANPAYSPDGKEIAFDYREPGSSIREIYVMNADGSGIRKVTQLQDVSGFATWSPDGTTIAFHSTALGGHAEIYTVPARGGDEKRITSSDLDAIQPAYSPDGAKIAFSRDGAIWTTENGEEDELTDPDDNDSAPTFRPVRSQ